MVLADGETETKDLTAWLAVAAGFLDPPHYQDHLIWFLTSFAQF